MLTILEKFPLRFITWIKTRKNIVLKKNGVLKNENWVLDGDRRIHFMLCMYAALHFPKMHITQLFFNRVLGENMNLRRETYVHIHVSV